MKAKQPKRRNKEPFVERYLGPILVTPSTLTIFGILLLPILFALYMSVNRISFKGASTFYKFAGLSNFISLFTTDPWFKESLFVTILFVVLTVAAEIVIGVAAALVLNKKFRGRGFVRGLMILPWAMPTVVNAVMWKWIFNAQYGAANGLLLKLGLVHTGVNWLATPTMAFLSVFIANVWKETPYVILLAIAGLSTIPDDLYEAASIDGAGGWKSFWRITLPMIRPVATVLLITKTIWTVQTYDLVYIMTAGGPQNTTQFITLLVQRTAFKYQHFGTAAAMSYSVTILCFVLTLLYIRVFLRTDNWSGSGVPAARGRKGVRR